MYVECRTKIFVIIEAPTIRYPKFLEPVGGGGISSRSSSPLAAAPSTLSTAVAAGACRAGHLPGRGSEAMN